VSITRRHFARHAKHFAVFSFCWAPPTKLTFLDKTTLRLRRVRKQPMPWLPAWITFRINVLP